MRERIKLILSAIAEGMIKGNQYLATGHYF